MRLKYPMYANSNQITPQPPNPLYWFQLSAEMLQACSTVLVFAIPTTQRQ